MRFKFKMEPQPLRRAVKTASQRALFKDGGFISRTASRSIRKAGKRVRVSRPGQPPKSHTGILKRFMRFHVGRGATNVIIGPMKTNQIFFDGDGRPVRGTVPKVLEEGGSIWVREVQQGNTWRRADLRSRRRLAGKRTRLRRVNIKPRPYMGPALVKSLPKLMGPWKNSIKG